MPPEKPQWAELYREVVVLRYFNELSVDEVAAVLGRHGDEPTVR